MTAKIQCTRGMSLIAVLASFVIIGIISVVMMKTWSQHYRATASIDRGVQSNQTSVEVLNDIVRQDFPKIVALCKGRGGFNTDLSDNCTDSGALKALSAQTLPAAGEPKLDVKLAADGNPSEIGTLCVGLTRCTTRSGGMVLDLHLRVYEATESKGVASVKQKSLMVRRAKW